MEAQQVLRRRALREDRRHRRPRPIGALVAQRLSAFGMNVIAYDPYVAAGRAAQMGVRLVVARRAAAQPATSSRCTCRRRRRPSASSATSSCTRSSPRSSSSTRPAAASSTRQALYAALKEGRVAAAGLDVYATEPCTDSPLFEFENVVATPHLGASTDEAQEKAGVAVAKSVRLALAGELVPDAVNVQGGVIAEDVRPGIPLAEKLGRIFTALAGGVAAAARRRGPRRDHRSTT